VLVSLVRCAEQDPPIVEVEAPVSRKVGVRLEKLGFEQHEDDDLHWAHIGNLEGLRKNASAAKLVEFLADRGIEATVAECDDEALCSWCESQEPQDESCDEALESDEAPGAEYTFALGRRVDALHAQVERMQDHIDFLERRLFWLAGSQHPDAPHRIIPQDEPDLLSHAGRKVHLDLIRKRPVAATPEEAVRQRVLEHLLKYLGYPEASLLSEWPLKRARSDARERADIVIAWGQDEEREFPAIVECKRPGVPLNDDVWAQVCGYARKLDARVVAITDGSELLTRVRDGRGGYVEAAGFPTFNELGAGRVPAQVFSRPRGVPRPDFEEIASGDAVDLYVEEYTAVPHDLEPERAAPALNIASLLLDDTQSPATGDLGAGWTLERDRGLLDSAFGNSGYGAAAYTGMYRGLVVTAPDGQAVLPFFAVKSAGYGRGRSTPILAIGFHHVDHGKRNHALQLNLLKGIVPDGRHFLLVHNGSLGLGEGGGIAGAQTREFLADCEPDLVVDDRVVLGKLPRERLITWQELVPVLGRLMRYAMACETLRATVRAKR
jgi:hypothetical protein